MNITLRQIHIFLTIAQTKTLAAASEQLCLSKPAVSMALHELELRLQVPLFDRVKNRLVLNSCGQQLLSQADEIYQRAAAFEKTFKRNGAIADSQSQLVIGATNTIGNYLLTSIIQQFRTQTGHHNQTVIIENTHDLCQKIQDFKVDIGLIEGVVDAPNLKLMPWRMDQLAIIVASDHPLTHKETITCADLAQTNWVLREPGSSSRVQFMQILAPFLSDWKIALTLSTTESIIQAVSCGLGFGLVSTTASAMACAAGHVQQLDVVDLPEALMRQFYVVVHERKYQSPLMESFQAQLFEETTLSSESI